jgi:hypothetical protein
MNEKFNKKNRKRKKKSRDYNHLLNNLDAERQYKSLMISKTIRIKEEDLCRQIQ